MKKNFMNHINNYFLENLDNFRMTISTTKFLFIFYIFFTFSLKATPTIREKYHNDYLKSIELIYDNHGIDIGNRDLYEGFTMNFNDECNAEVKLKTYKPLIKFFSVNICENKTKLVYVNLNPR